MIVLLVWVKTSREEDNDDRMGGNIEIMDAFDHANTVDNDNENGSRQYDDGDKDEMSEDNDEVKMHKK